jgi:hypothetical protein
MRTALIAAPDLGDLGLVTMVLPPFANSTMDGERYGA